MKLIVVLLVIGGCAAANNNDKALRGVNEATRSRSKRQFECFGLISDLVGSCQDEFTALTELTDFTNTTVFFEQFCTSDCVPPVLRLLDECVDSGVSFSLADVVRQSCAQNLNNATCASQHNAIISSTTDISSACLDFGFSGFSLPDPLVCPENCSSALQASNADIGCCISLQNITGLTAEILPVADYSLWSACGVEPLGFCEFTGGAVASGMGASVLLALFLALLVAVFN